jgi:hypothetical protein
MPIGFRTAAPNGEIRYGQVWEAFCMAGLEIFALLATCFDNPSLLK